MSECIGIDGAVWTNAALTFIMGDPAAWKPGQVYEHDFSSAYQEASEALVALGQADEVPWGAVIREHRALPAVLPRWDDICCKVLYLADQLGAIDYRLPDGSSSWSRDLPPANIHGGNLRLGNAYADSRLQPVLEPLGLVAEGKWTAAAEFVIWRGWPQEWRQNFPTDPRFLKAVDHASTVIPPDIQDQLETLATITDADMEEGFESDARHRERVLADPKTKVRIMPVSTRADIRKKMEYSNLRALEWLFYRRWRLADGWLSPEEAARAFYLSRDSLADEARRAVIARLYPDKQFLMH